MTTTIDHPRSKDPTSKDAADTEHFRGTIRAFVDEAIAPKADLIDTSQHIPTSVLSEVADAGLMGSIFDINGAEPSDIVHLGILHQEVGRGCSSVRSILTVQSMVIFAVQRFGTQQQRSDLLPRLAKGELLGSFALSEPQAGSDAASIATIAEEAPQGQYITGVKRWITGGQIADLFLVFARESSGITAFLVHSDNPGVTVAPIYGMLGTRGSMIAEVRFDRAFVPDSDRIGASGFGLVGVGLSALDIGRFSVASGSVGIIDASLEMAISYANERRVKAGPLIDQQLIRKMISDGATDLRAARLLCADAARLKVERNPETVEATMTAKYFSSRAALRVASDALQICGATGCSSDSPAGRYFRDAKVMEIIEGSNEIQQINIAKFASDARGAGRNYPKDGR